ALAPVGYGAYGGDLLVGNFGDGRINVFDPKSGAWLGALLANTNGTPIEVSGLWAIAFGNGHSGGDAHTLYFTAGINGQNDGLFGSIAAITPTFIGITENDSGITLNWAGGGAGPFNVQQNTNLLGTNWVTIATTTTNSVTLGNTNPAAFFRVQNEQ
ncbi:MAG TPA: TIGR03118 family protein, partial [Candidatus Acidoferrales bacterium]|nr:TIGR03118 family protein [Candidatus Acidoferrales bacterium]